MRSAEKSIAVENGNWTEIMIDIRSLIHIRCSRVFSYQTSLRGLLRLLCTTPSRRFVIMLHPSRISSDVISSEACSFLPVVCTVPAPVIYTDTQALNVAPKNKRQMQNAKPQRINNSIKCSFYSICKSHHLLDREVRRVRPPELPEKLLVTVYLRSCHEVNLLLS